MIDVCVRQQDALHRAAICLATTSSSIVHFVAGIDQDRLAVSSRTPTTKPFF